MLRFDFSGLLAENIGEHGIPMDAFHTDEEMMNRYITQVWDEKPGFTRLPYEDVSYIEDTLAQFRDRSIDDVLVLGIGGSALGTIATRDAIKGVYWNYLSSDGRHGLPRLWVPDNVDPYYVGRLLEMLDPRHTLVIVVSKSGRTAETASQYLIVRKWLESVDVIVKEHLIFITDPEKGVLREIARKEGIMTFDIPPDVGGRFSVLTPVGLVPLALVGVDIGKLVSGAKKMAERCKMPFMENPAALIAYSHMYLFEKGKNMAVMFAYSNNLANVADWYRQLWAESLGKRYTLDGKEVLTGQTPIKAVGTTDQHSQVQLYNEGPFDKVITFLRVEDFGIDVNIPHDVHEDITDLDYLKGHTLKELILAEQFATYLAVTDNGRPAMQVVFPAVDEEHLGEFFFVYEFATALAGKVLGINPYDQPGVEAGKNATYALMGRKGYEDLAASIKEKLSSMKSFQL